MRKQKGLPCLTQYQRVCLPWSDFKLLATKKIQNQANCGLLVIVVLKDPRHLLNPFKLGYIIDSFVLKTWRHDSTSPSNLKACFFIALHSVVEHWETRCFNLWIWNNPSHITSTARRSKKRRPLQARCIAVRSARLAHTHLSSTSLITPEFRNMFLLTRSCLQHALFVFVMSGGTWGEREQGGGETEHLCFSQLNV